jgi:hypothetical protein
LTLTPNGGVGNIPALIQGQPGAPALINATTVSTLAAGSSATFSLTQTNAGGPGQSSTYTANLGIPQGAQGTAGSSGTIHGASDLSGTAAVGNILTVSQISPSTAFVYSAMPFGNMFNTPSSSISSVSLTGQASQTMATLAVPAQSYAWYPAVSAQGTVVGTTNTVVNLTAWLNTVSTGNVLGKVSGYAGQATQLLTMIPSLGALAGSGSPAYGQVAAGASANIILVAQQTASTGDSCTIGNSTAAFTVQMVPV